MLSKTSPCIVETATLPAFPWRKRIFLRSRSSLTIDYFSFWYSLYSYVWLASFSWHYVCRIYNHCSNNFSYFCIVLCSFNIPQFTYSFDRNKGCCADWEYKEPCCIIFLLNDLSWPVGTYLLDICKRCRIVGS